MKVFSNGVRFCCAFLLLETMTQFIYANSIAKYRLWEGPSPSLAVQLNALQFGVIGFWVLTFIWMKVQQLFDVLPFDVVFWKFLVIWSFSSLWSMADEIDPPENMCRCLYNNYDIEVSLMLKRGNFDFREGLLEELACFFQSLVGALSLHPTWWTTV